MKRFMLRALQLARHGYGFVSPNPMVGCVIVHDQRIIGEGWHRRWGEAHAEVNAFAAIARKDLHLIPKSTLYVTLEPCSHHGKTGPCSDLIIEKGIKNIVVGMADPFEAVSGRGIERLRKAGCNVTVGLLEEQCRELNERFILAHTRHRPWVMLKWAEDAAGNIASLNKNNEPSPLKISSPLTTLRVNKLRAGFDAIMVGTRTANIDHPGLTTRGWPARTNPVAVTFNRHGNLLEERFCKSRTSSAIIIRDDCSIPQILESLYRQGVTSLLVEGGAALLQSFIHSGCWDMARIEKSDAILCSRGVRAPRIEGITKKIAFSDGHLLSFISPFPDNKTI